METYRKKLTPNEAWLKIQNYCSYQERCHQEVREKLYGYGLLKTDVEEQIYNLIQQNFLNEERFAKAFVRGKFNYKKWGKTKITLKLKQKGISPYCIKKGLEEIDGEKYQEVLCDLIEKEMSKTTGLSSFQLNGKVAKKCILKGFESQLVWRLIKSNTNES